jgi:hypothetical protein
VKSLLTASALALLPSERPEASWLRYALDEGREALPATGEGDGAKQLG